MSFHNLAFWFLFFYPFSSGLSDNKPAVDDSTHAIAIYPVLDQSMPADSQRTGQRTYNSYYTAPPVVTKQVFKSNDGGETWQNISAGLPTLGYDYQPNSLFADESGLFLRDGIGLYHNSSDSKSAQWAKEIFPNKHNNIAAGQHGMLAYSSEGQFLQKTAGSKLWSPVYKNFQHPGVNSVVESAGGSVFVTTTYGLYKSADNGKTWKQSSSGKWVIKLVESGGVLLATSQDGIIRSTDDGESWDRVIYEGGVGIDVEPIKGGFVAIAYNSAIKARRVQASYDGGKTWQAIDKGLTPHLQTSSIVELGDAFYCGHPEGIFKSTDKGKSWKLLFASPEGAVFSLFVSGNVLYAVPRSGGC